MRCDQDFSSTQSNPTHVFNQVAVVTDQHRSAKTARQIEHSQVRSAANGVVLECMQLAVTVNRPVRKRHDVAVVESTVCPCFHKSRPNCHSVFARQLDQ